MSGNSLFESTTLVSVSYRGLNIYKSTVVDGKVGRKMLKRLA